MLYTVKIPQVYFSEVVVEAESLDEARQEAENMEGVEVSCQYERSIDQHSDFESGQWEAALAISLARGADAGSIVDTLGDFSATTAPHLHRAKNKDGFLLVAVHDQLGLALIHPLHNIRRLVEFPAALLLRRISANAARLTAVKGIASDLQDGKYAIEAFNPVKDEISGPTVDWAELLREEEIEE